LGLTQCRRCENGAIHGPRGRFFQTGVQPPINRRISSTIICFGVRHRPLRVSQRAGFEKIPDLCATSPTAVRGEIRGEFGGHPPFSKRPRSSLTFVCFRNQACRAPAFAPERDRFSNSASAKMAAGLTRRVAEVIRFPTSPLEIAVSTNCISGGVGAELLFASGVHVVVSFGCLRAFVVLVGAGGDLAVCRRREAVQPRCDPTASPVARFNRPLLSTAFLSVGRP